LRTAEDEARQAVISSCFNKTIVFRKLLKPAGSVQFKKNTPNQNCNNLQKYRRKPRGTAAAVPPPFRLGDPALCGHPLVTPHIGRYGDLLFFFVSVCAYCIFVLFVYYLSLQYFDSVGWVF